MISVLFVCAGNICRSPMAEAVFQDMVNKAGLSDKIHVDSAGTGNWHEGETAHRGTLKVLKQQNILYSGRSRQLNHADLDKFDFVLAMDYSNLSNIRRLANSKKSETNMFLYYANVASTETKEEVPDPYYNDRFDEVYDLAVSGSAALLKHIRATHKL